MISLHHHFLEVELAEPSALLLTLSTGRNKVLKAALKVASPGITFHLREAYLSGGWLFTSFIIYLA